MAEPFHGIPDRADPPTGPSGRLAVVLPGRAYSPAAPLLELSRQVALQHGWSVRQVWWDAPPLGAEYDARSWVVGQLEAAVADEETAPDRLLVVAKSLGTRAAATTLAADFVLLTPLLTDEAEVDDLRTAIGRGSRVLLVGGTADELWSTEVAHGLGCEVLEVDGADHALCHDGDAVRSAEVLVEVTRAVDAFVARLG